MKDSTVQLTITARHSTTVLPRCLQILSRRGFTLDELRSEPAGDEVIMHCRLTGPARWHESLKPLLERVIDVHTVSTNRQTVNEEQSHE